MVDALAKHAASQRRAPIAIRRLLASGRAAVRHAAALLGQVTHAANNCLMECLLPDGTTERRVCRDAQQARSARKRKRDGGDEEAAVPAHPVSTPDTTDAARNGGPLLPRSCQQKRASATRERALLLKAEQEGHIRRRLAEIAAASVPAAGKPSGAERLEQLQRRVRARISATSTALAGNVSSGG